MFSCIWLFVSPWTVTHQAPLSMGLSRQEYWSGLPFPFPDLEMSWEKLSQRLMSFFLTGSYSFCLGHTWVSLQGCTSIENYLFSNLMLLIYRVKKKKQNQSQLTQHAAYRKRMHRVGMLFPVSTWRLSTQFSTVAQSCLTLCDPMDCSTPGLPVHH